MVTKMQIGDDKYTSAKNKKKVIKVVLQVICLLALAVVLVLALFTFKKYVPFQQRSDVPVSNDRGFVALSYFGVARTGTSDLIANDRLAEHLRALKLNGYETITQQDIIDYYANKSMLPEKALFISFEDGRRDTAIFAQKILENLNYKGTAMTYPEKFELKDNKFLMPEELRDLEGNGFWEMGTNGYRLAFINCYDRYNNYLGELTPLKHAMVAPYMGRKYNHYLMDYVRDESFFPKESYNMMQDRISYDYEKLRDIYKQELGYVPKAYTLMHSNTGWFGNNPDVSAVNEKWITDLFAMNFNREGYSWNNKKSSIYDLTRMQPQPYWYTNHLLMRIAHDQPQPIKFVQGDAEEAKKWLKLAGESEFKTEKIVLTTEPDGKSLLFLKNMNAAADVHIKATLTGNKYGAQTIYMRTNEKLSRAIAVKLVGNYLFVRESGKELLKLDLNKFDGKAPVSVAEDRRAAEAAELKAFARYAPTKAQGEIYLQRMREREAQEAASVEEGAQEYVPDINIRELGKRDIEIFLRGHELRLKVDGRNVLETVQVSDTASGKVALEASFMQQLGWSQRNLADDVYDGVFEKLMIYDYQRDYQPQPLLEITVLGHKLSLPNPFDDVEPVLYDSRLHGVEGVLHTLAEYWEKLLHFFIHSF